MTSKTPIPLPTRGERIESWANKIVTYLRGLESNIDVPGPKIVQLETRVANASAAQNGILMWDATVNSMVVSYNGQWYPVTLGAPL